jgi:hypothetical protein
MYRPSVLLALLALLAACDGRGLGPNDDQNTNQAQPDGSVILPDGAPDPDGGGSCESGRSTLLRSAEITSITLLQDALSEEGQTVRVLAGLSLGACEQLAAVRFQVEETSEQITLHALRWIDVGVGLDCTGDLAWFQEIVELRGLHAGAWTVRDGSGGSNGGVATFTVSPCAEDFDCFCEPGSQPAPLPRFSECRYDCDCEAGLRCVGVWGFDMLHWQCGQTCAVDSDCFGWDQCMFAADGPYGLCEAKSPIPEDCTELACDEGLVCVSQEGLGAWCQPEFEVWRTGDGCTCDENCPAGLHCLDPGTGEMAICGAPCLGDLDCPEYAVCGENPAWADALPICFMLED